MYDHLMFISHEQFETPDESGFPQLFNKYPPRKVVLLTTKPDDSPPDSIREATGGQFDDFEFHMVRPLGADALEDEALPFLILNDIYDGLAKHLPNYLNLDQNCEPLLITLSTGSTLHSYLLMTVGLAINARFITLDGRSGDDPVSIHDWLNEGASFSVESNSSQERKARNILSAMLIQKTMIGPTTDYSLHGFYTADEITGGLQGELPLAHGFHNTAKPLVLHGFLQEEKEIHRGELENLEPTLTSYSEGIDAAEKEERTPDETAVQFMDCPKCLVIAGVPCTGLDTLSSNIAHPERCSALYNKTKELRKRVRTLKNLLTEPNRYRLTASGWLAALQSLSHTLESEGLPLYGIDGSEATDLAWLYPNDEKKIRGRVTGIRAFKKNISQKLNVTNILNTIGSADANITIYCRQRPEMPGAAIEWDRNITLTFEEGGTFTDYQKEWEDELDKRQIIQDHWCLFDALGSGLDEAFRLFCEWAWPRLTTKLRDRLGEEVPVQWSLDVNQLTRPQMICASLLAQNWLMSMTYVAKRGGELGVRDFEVPSSSRSATLQQHIIELPDRAWAKLVTGSFLNGWDIQHRVLVALYIWKLKRSELIKDRREMRKADPLAWEQGMESIPRPEIHIVNLREKIDEFVDLQQLPEDYRLVSEGGVINVGRTPKDLQSKGWISTQKEGNRLLMALTPFGEFLARIIMESRGDSGMSE
jgi:hypothetical protein